MRCKVAPEVKVRSMVTTNARQIRLGHLGSYPRMLIRSFVVLAAIAIAGCSPTPSTAPGATSIATAGSSRPAPTTSVPAATDVQSSSIAPSAAPSGFAFLAEDVIAYYRSIGYTCAAPHPSTQAAGYTLTPCELTEPNGRTRLVGIVTDAEGRLGNGYAGVWSAPGETYLDPDDALDPLAAFLGTMLGAEAGGDAAVWLREHLGASYVETTLGSMSVATYTGTDDDPSELYVEVADRAYLEASPAPPS